MKKSFTTQRTARLLQFQDTLSGCLCGRSSLVRTRACTRSRSLRRLSGSPAACLGYSIQIAEKPLPFPGEQRGQDFSLHENSYFARFRVFAATCGREVKPTRPPIFFMTLPLQQLSLLHALDQRCHGVGIAGHRLCQLALGQAFVLKQGAHDSELVRSQSQMSDATSEGLVQTIPGPAQQRRQPAALGRVNRRF